MCKIKTLNCVILTGGKSSRMGSNKALLPFGNVANLLTYQYNKMCKIFQNVFISCKESLDFDLKSACLYENRNIFSPLVGIESSFLHLKEKKIFFISVDAPFIKAHTIETLCSVHKDYDVIYPKTNQKSHYLIALWDYNTCDQITQTLQEKEYKIGKLIDKLHTYCIDFEDEEEFNNLNTPKDYQHALSYLRKQNG
ncbi:molybdenum cofactor guanylyltransferase MobA [Helicobacter sp. 11S03491-1]|uniref:molybdenum cofactor guanylyltransferase MobA n=1 Tax=Helicobacter sp. 11S03491-1 TaxID=1476196 RepID=UPI000BC81087|nr:molybdenum cofactor guanylyltransferase MobA [Helicobacter sp. 11S03491-1]PAF43050.1 hypothetical protein BKH45_03000 [Helicobacter sp. 11S03491-1]